LLNLKNDYDDETTMEEESQKLLANTEMDVETGNAAAA